MMLFLSDRLKDSWRRLMSFWPILVPAVATFVMYAMVHWEERYTIGAMPVVFGTAMAATGFSGAGRSAYVLRAASLTLGLSVVCWVLPLSMLNAYLDGLNSAQQVVVAERLRAMGIEPGDHVAMIGDGFNEYWARLEKVRIVAEAPNLNTDKTGDSPAEFWDSSPEIELRVLNILKSAGAKAVIAPTAHKGSKARMDADRRHRVRGLSLSVRIGKFRNWRQAIIISSRLVLVTLELRSTTVFRRRTVSPILEAISYRQSGSYGLGSISLHLRRDGSVGRPIL